MTSFAQIFPRRFGWIVVMFALQCSPVIAVEIDDAARSNVTSSPQKVVSWISGGVGDEAMAEMHKVSTAYNVQLLLTGASGNYLAGVPFSVSHKGKVTASGVTEGPLLYIKLPAGSYQIAVEIDGAWQTKRIQTSTSGQATKLRFVAKGKSG